MEKVIHRAATRGYFDHGWLQTFHTFSFADYYNPQRIHFGALRVLNDDTVAGGEGFGSHPHDNMEMLSRSPCRASCATKTAWATAKCCDRAKYR